MPQTRQSPLGTLVCVYNFSNEWQALDVAALQAAGVTQWFDMLGNTAVHTSGGTLAFPPQGRIWLT